MKQFYMLISLLFIINYGLCRNIPPQKSTKRQAISTETEISTKVENESNSHSITTTKNLPIRLVKHDCHNNTCSLEENNESIPTSFEINGKNITFDDLQFKHVKISKLKIPIFELENETFGQNIVQDFVSGAHDIKGRIIRFGQAIKSHFSRRSEPRHVDNEEILKFFDISNLLQHTDTAKSIYLIFLVDNPEKATYEQTTEYEHDILEMEESKFFDVIHEIEKMDMSYVNLKEYFRTKMSETVPTSTFKMNTKNKNSNISELEDQKLVIQEPDSKIKRALKAGQNTYGINEFVLNGDDREDTTTDENENGTSTTEGNTTNENENGTNNTEDNTTNENENGTNNTEGNTTNENESSTNKTETQYKKRKPYFLIVTLPTAICWGLVVIFLCYCMRSGGWCCNLFKDVSEDEESSSD